MYLLQPELSFFFGTGSQDLCSNLVIHCMFYRMGNFFILWMSTYYDVHGNFIYIILNYNRHIEASIQ